MYLCYRIVRVARQYLVCCLGMFWEKKNFCICRRLNIQTKTINLKFKFLSNSTCDNKSNTIINLQILVLCLLSDNISHARLCLPTQNRRRKKNVYEKTSFFSYIHICDLCCYIFIFSSAFMAIYALNFKCVHTAQKNDHL